MPRGDHIRFDRQAFHQYLWDRRDDRDEIVVKVKDVAALLECRYPTVTRMLEDLAAQGKVQKLSRASHDVGSGSAGWNYKIQNPLFVTTGAKAADSKGPRQIQWG